MGDFSLRRIGRQPRDCCNNGWDGFRNVPCSHYYGAFSGHLVLFSVPHCLSYVWLVASQITAHIAYYMTALSRLKLHPSIHIILIFFVVCWGDFAANYKAVRCLSLATLNCERSSILLLHYLETGEGEMLNPKNYV